jgi:DHA1 family bicyclomycin/chloramphenicol resistance-like MFS transporter
MQTSLVRSALILGLLTAIGPFAIDMYLPALPAIGRNLNAEPHLVLATLTVFFIAFGSFQVVFGALSDIVGRKPPLYFGLSLFLLTSIGCALATDIYMLIGLRVLQGIAAAASIVIPGAVVRDLHTGLEATKLMSLLMLVFGVCPILAPSVGSVLIGLWDWRAVFWFIALAAFVGLVLVATLLKETRSPAARAKSSIKTSFEAFGSLLMDRHFVGLSLNSGFALAGVFVYLGGSSFVLIDHYGLSPMSYSIAFSANAAGLFGSAQLNGWLGARFPLAQIVRVAATAYAVIMVTLFALVFFGVERLEVILVLLFVGFVFVGQIMPITTVLAMHEHGSIAGAAYSLLGTIRLIIGGAAIAVSGYFADGTAGPMIAGVAFCAVTAFVLCQLTLGGAKRAAGTARAG